MTEKIFFRKESHPSNEDSPAQQLAEQLIKRYFPLKESLETVDYGNIENTKKDWPLNITAHLDTLLIQYYETEDVANVEKFQACIDRIAATTPPDFGPGRARFFDVLEEVTQLCIAHGFYDQVNQLLDKVRNETEVFEGHFEMRNRFALQEAMMQQSVSDADSTITESMDAITSSSEQTKLALEVMSPAMNNVLLATPNGIEWIKRFEAAASDDKYKKKMFQLLRAQAIARWQTPAAALEYMRSLELPVVEQGQWIGVIAIEAGKKGDSIDELLNMGQTLLADKFGYAAKEAYAELLRAAYANNSKMVDVLVQAYTNIADIDAETSLDERPTMWMIDIISLMGEFIDQTHIDQIIALLPDEYKNFEGTALEQAIASAIKMHPVSSDRLHFALKYIDQLRRISQESEEYSDLSQALSHVAIGFVRFGDFSRAEVFLRESEKLPEPFENERVAECIRAIALRKKEESESQFQ